MAKGAAAKNDIFKKMLETFEGSFMYNGGKELRIPWYEGDTLVQIKVALTCAKENVVVGEDSSTGIGIAGAAVVKEEDAASNFPAPKKIVEPSPEEKQNVEDLLSALGLN